MGWFRSKKLSFWLMLDYGKLTIIRANRDPSGITTGRLVDGPFDTQEDAARAYAFWRAQLADILYSMPTRIHTT